MGIYDFVTAFYAINHPDQFFQKLNSEDFPLVGFVAFAAAFGIILGHLIHQVSLFLGLYFSSILKKIKDGAVTLEKNSR
ncbi:hypothetical protein AAV30_08965 [Bacillus velezensis]|uniref:hypothetical protein n=1 Tax=Bacillus velezensis TaxID=492670 RepID=UPI000624609F|nr:hypothetical protein [Bacillus velezensis]AKF76283.1 hypothetical protein AAV30_08965 [Bacillus velezensis]